MAATDIHQMYLNVRLAPECVGYFGFSITDVSGEDLYFVFLSIPFGYGPACAIMDDLITPLRVKLHQLSVDVTWYIDDSINIALSFQRCSDYQELTRVFSNGAGWILSLDKLVLPTTKILYLGFIIDSQVMKIFCPDRKVFQLIADLDYLMVNRDKVPHKLLAAALGSCAHMITSHSNVIRLVTRVNQHNLGVSVNQTGWNGHIDISDHMVKEMKLCQHFLISANGTAIRRHRKEFHIVRPAAMAYHMDDWDPDHSTRQLIHMVSDASNTCSYLYEADTFRITREYPFDMNEQQASSTMRELLSIHRLFINDVSYVQSISGMAILWHTDNQAVQHIMTKGSRIPALQSKVLEIAELQLKYGE